MTKYSVQKLTNYEMIFDFWKNNTNLLDGGDYVHDSRSWLEIFNHTPKKPYNPLSYGMFIDNELIGLSYCFPTPDEQSLLKLSKMKGTSSAKQGFVHKLPKNWSRIRMTAVKDKYRGKGYASILLKYLLENVKSTAVWGLVSLELFPLYEKSGFMLTQTSVESFNQRYYFMKYDKA